MIGKVAVIGAGPSGISAVIQLKRYGIDPVLLEKEEIGGLLKNANLVENYLGFPKGISGRQLIKLFKKQLESHRIYPIFEEVLKVDYQDNIFVIATTKSLFVAEILVLASGTIPKKINDFKIPYEVNKRIFYEIYNLDGIKNKKIAIVGAGDAAFDYALNLSKNNEIVILNRSNNVKCLPLLFERAMKNENISYMESININKVLYQNNLLTLSCRHFDEPTKIDVSYLLIAIGRKPNVGFLSENLKENLLKLKELNKLYMIGDLQNGIYRQTAIAVGDGIKAAMRIYNNFKMQNLL